MNRILFVHAPKFSNYYPMLGEFMSVTQMPSGLLGLAGIAKDQGRETEVLHLGLEKALNKKFSLGAYLEETLPGLIFLSLHFHPQSNDAVRAIGLIRAKAPGAFLVLGGYTATFFASEIMDRYPQVDAVCLGESENAVRAISRLFPKRGEDLAAIPGLAWRHSSGQVRFNCGSATDIGNLKGFCRTRLELMRHGAQYLKLAQFLHYYSWGWSFRRNLKNFGSPIGFALPVARGCVHDCLYCGGGSRAQSRINQRRGVTFLALGHVLAELQDLKKREGELFLTEYIASGDGDDYYLELFNSLKKRKNSLHANIDCRGIPSGRFLETFAQVFPSFPSHLNLSPEAAREPFRKKVKVGVALGDTGLYSALAHMERLKIKSEVYFSIGLPGETPEDVVALEETVREIRKRFSSIRAVRIHGIELDPGSPLFMEPEKHNMVDPLRTFEEYRAYHGSWSSMLSDLGYGVIDHEGRRIGREEHTRAVNRLICRRFCRAMLPRCASMPASLRKGAMLGTSGFCRTLETRFFIKRSLGRVPELFPY
ncbi:MAG: cobalamin-dependent protein [Thermodesulfobacteriota bacterium]